MARKKYLIEVIQIGSGDHTHIQKRTNDLSLVIEGKGPDDSDIEIKVSPKDLYEVPISFLPGFIKFLRTGMIRHYVIIVNPEGIPIEEKSPEISGKVLKVARDWRGLGKAISDSFGSNWEIPRIGIVLGIGLALLIFAVFVWRGWIPLPRSWTQ